MRRAAAAALAAALALAAPATAQEPPAGVDPCGEGRYRGKKIDLDVKELDLHNLFRLLATAGGANLVVSDDVRGTATLQLEGVPWDQVLCTVARTKRLRVWREDRVFYVVPR